MMIARQIVYEGTVEKFREDVLSNMIASIMEENYTRLAGYNPKKSEFRSWNNSLRFLKDLIELAKIKDNMIALEYTVPYTSERIDCLIFGKGTEGKAYVVVIELKQWSEVSLIPGENNFIETWTGGRTQKVCHPCEQVKGYHDHLLSFVQIFEYDPTMGLFSCVYCHNYSKEKSSGLFDNRFAPLRTQFPLYAKEDVRELAQKLHTLLSEGKGLEIFNRFMQSPLRPSKKLLENTAKIIDHQPVYSLLDDQIVAKNIILSKVSSAEEKGEQSTVIVKGGPGTGKSLIALHILADLAKRDQTVFFACKSKPFREALSTTVGGKSKMLFVNLTALTPSKVPEGQIDVLIVDEAHRIEKTGNNRYTSKLDRTTMPQVEQLIRCAKTSVFFIDDYQRIRGQEIGSTDLIRDTARQLGRTVEEWELVSQFRCNGSQNYLDWLEAMLGYQTAEGEHQKPQTLGLQENFDFRIFSSVQRLYDFLLQKEKEQPNSARLTAGFCWEWSKTLDENGQLRKDVKVGDFEMPWETHLEITPPPGYVQWYEWGYKTEGIKQIGCIYTAQGFEYDYIGVIVGPDIKYDREHDCLAGDLAGTKDPKLRHDKANFGLYVKNIYRVLMSRAMKGCYVFFVDKEVEAYFMKHISSELRENFTE